MEQREDPLSLSSITAHVVVLIVLVGGGAIIEGIKYLYEPPFMTYALLNISEFTVFVYMIGGLGKAIRWAWHQWTTNTPLSDLNARSLFHQLRPKKIDFKSSLERGRITRTILLIFIAVLIVLVFAEIFPHEPQYSRIVIPNDHPQNVKAINAAELVSRTQTLSSVFVNQLNLYSVEILSAIAVLSTLTILLAILIIGVRFTRQRRVSQAPE